ncbi:hypothetical protein NL676_020821 [Syzygium grande]|nr:hypothetical protein NL676_020821 [Syzygium grande]
MHAASRARRLRRILKPPVHLGSAGFIPPNDCQVVECAQICARACRYRSSSSFSPSAAAQSLGFAGPVHGNRLPAAPYSIILRLPYSSEASAEKEEPPTETVKEMYDKIVESINTKRTMAPNNGEDIKLFFDVLQNLRRFRFSNLRIHENFNCNLCREVTEGCVRARALDFGKKALWKHNVYGLTPTIGSANHLLQYAKEHKDATLMQEVMKLLKTNNLPLQPSTADIVFRAAFDIWMELLQKQKLRSESMKQHTEGSGFSCAKEAATVIHVLNQSLPDVKRSSIMVELQKLVSEWPVEVIKQKKEDDHKALAATLKANILAMNWRLNALAADLSPMWAIEVAMLVSASSAEKQDKCGNHVSSNQHLKFSCEGPRAI